MQLISCILGLKTSHGIPSTSRQQLKEGFDPEQLMVWLHSGQRDLSPPSRQPVVYGVGEGGSNSPGCSGLTSRTFNKVSESQVRQWAMGDTVSLGFPASIQPLAWTFPDGPKHTGSDPRS